MHADAEAWIAKAEGDFMGATTLVKRRSQKLAHLTCFAAQQSAEKFLKAYLVEQNVAFSKTHDLTKDLLPRCLKVDEEFSVLYSQLEYLDPYAVESRYPGDIVTHAEATRAVKAAKAVRKFVLDKLKHAGQARIV